MRREEDAWLARRRNACGEIAAQGSEALAECVGRAYDERIAELQQLVSGPPSPAPAVAMPSFDCRNARTRVEQAICADPVLAAKDRRMARLYERASVFGMPVEGSQRDWRAARDACARQGADALEPCVHELYDARIRDLRSVAAR